jgi:hypothetical protein
MKQHLDEEKLLFDLMPFLIKVMKECQKNELNNKLMNIFLYIVKLISQEIDA